MTCPVCNLNCGEACARAIEAAPPIQVFAPRHLRTIREQQQRQQRALREAVGPGGTP